MRWLVFIFLLLLLPAAAEAKAKKLTPQPEDIDSITVLAPTSMAVPISQLCKIYSLKTKKDVNAVFDSTADNIINIQEGDPADIVIIPSRKWFLELDSKGLVDAKGTKILAKNNLAIVAAKNFGVARANAKTALNNIYNKALLVVADEEQDALGEYTNQSLIKLGLWDKFHARVVLAPNSAAVTDLIIKGQTAGIVFASDARLYSSKLDILSLIAPQDHKPIEYLGAVLIGEDMEEARTFLDFLASKQAKEIFRKYGFVLD